MNNQIRYFSRNGHTKAVADEIASQLNTIAVSTDSDNSLINEEVDNLFIGGGLYAYGLDKNLSEYIDKIDATKIKRVILFSTSWLSKHALSIMKEKFEAKNVEVYSKNLYFKSKDSNNCKQEVSKLLNELKI